MKIYHLLFLALLASGTVLMILGIEHTFMAVSCPPSAYSCINIDNDPFALVVGSILTLIGAIGLTASIYGRSRTPNSASS